MKRSTIFGVVVINLTLLGGWIAFELRVAERPANASSSREASVEPNMVPVTPQPGDPAPGVSEMPDQDRVAREDSPASLFDWRKRSQVARAERSEQTTQRIGPVQGNRASPASKASPAQTRATEGSRESEARQTVQSPSRRDVPTGTSDSSPETPPIEEPRDPSEDREPPKLEWIRFTPGDIAAGSQTILSSFAADDLAGVRDIVGRISSPSGNAHIGFVLPHDAAAGTWESAIRIPAQAEAGTWQITWLRITDKANNSRDERWARGQGPPGTSLKVESAAGDGDPPVLHSVALDSPTVSSADPVRVIVDVRDELSGVRFVSGTFQSPSGKAWASFTAERDGAVWAGPVIVPEDGECGEWSLRRITAIDEANNQATWGTGDERIRSVVFYRNFSGGSCDAEPPIVTRLELSPNHVTNEEDAAIRVTAWIDDRGSGVANASGFAMVTNVEEVPQRVHFSLRKEGEGPGAIWVGTMQVPRHSMAGRWEIRALRVSDEARNQRTYSASDPVMAGAWFIVD